MVKEKFERIVAKSLRKRGWIVLPPRRQSKINDEIEDTYWSEYFRLQEERENSLKIHNELINF